MTMLAIGHLPQGQASLTTLPECWHYQANSEAIDHFDLKEKVMWSLNLTSATGACEVVITETGKQALLKDGLLGINFFKELFHDFSRVELEILWRCLRNSTTLMEKLQLILKVKCTGTIPRRTLKMKLQIEPLIALVDQSLTSLSQNYRPMGR
jgi:hypothetical protein